MIQLPDLRQVAVLSKAEWLRIQDEMNNVNKEKESMIEAVKQREALHLESKEMVKLWSNSIAAQRQKKLEAKAIREEIEEERRKLIDIEEAKYKEQKRKEAVEKAKIQLYYQTDRVKGLHRALLLSEVLKEREAQIELKQRIKSASKDVEKKYLDVSKSREEETLRQEQEKTQQKKLQNLTLAEELKNRIKENELTREQHKLENKKEGEEIQRLLELYHWEQRKEQERQEKQRRDLMQAHLEHMANRDVIKAAEAQQQEMEEEQRKLFLSAKEKMVQLRKDKEAELFREAQMCRKRIIDKLTVTQQQQTESDEQRIARAVAEREAKEAELHRDKEEQRAAMLASIMAHRETTRQEKEEREKTRQQNARDTLQAKKEADRIFTEKQQQKAQKNREEERKAQDFNATQMVQKYARQQQQRRDEHEFEAKNAQIIAEEENQFQLYSRHVINAAAQAQRNVFPLYKAAREGIGGGLGPVFGGVRPSFIVQDDTGVQMPTYISSATQNVKKLNEAVDIQEAKRRLGFTW
uniref:Coiled-coil domain containing 173 n=2 Tax=Sphaeramia orbicularis TaxID=375764 RepID=A0A672YK07_9TELE